MNNLVIEGVSERVRVKCVRHLPSLVQYFKSLRERVIAMQPATRQTAMAQCFDSLMDKVERNLQPRNRDL